jgi:MFS family permease
LFCLSCIPYGVYGSFTATVMPRLAKLDGLDLDAIGWLGTALLMPSWIQFIYAPIVDIGPKRKHWLVIMSGVGALLLLAACLMPIREHRNAFLAFAVSSAFLTGLISSCNGGLMSVVVPDEQRGRAGAWYMVGNLSGGALSAAVALWLIDHNYDGWSYGGALAAMMFLPSLAILFVHEPDRDNVQRIDELFATAFNNIGEALWSKTGITGILLFLSPVATAALVNYFSAMADDYHASTKMIWFVNGWANGLLTAVGSLFGGYLCDRYNRRALYLLSGLATAVCGIAMVLSPRTEWTYAWGVCGYFLITGVCYAAYSAAVLETVGAGGKTASTTYALFNAASNVAITWVGFVDTRFDKRWHVEGVIGADAGLNLIGVAVLTFVFWKLGAFGKWRHREE